MRTTRHYFVAVALAACALLGFALYLQHGQGLQPCPLCVIQRYAFLAVALACLAGALLPRPATRFFAFLGSLLAIAGAGVAGWHLWVKAHPAISCGIDPLETSLNTLPSATWLPFLFRADGFCSAPTPPVLGLSIPQWSLAWFLLFALALGWRARR